MKQKGKSKGSANRNSDDESLDLLIRWWNTLQEKKLVTGVARTPPSKGVGAGWNRVKKSPELQSLLSDKAAIEAKIEQSTFLREANWFDLPKLLGGTNKDGEYVIQRLLYNGYADTPRPMPRNANVGPGVTYDPLRKIEN